MYSQKQWDDYWTPNTTRSYSEFIDMRSATTPSYNQFIDMRSATTPSYNQFIDMRSATTPSYNQFIDMRSATTPSYNQFIDMRSATTPSYNQFIDMRSATTPSYNQFIDMRSATTPSYNQFIDMRSASSFVRHIPRGSISPPSSEGMGERGKHDRPETYVPVYKRTLPIDRTKKVSKEKVAEKEGEDDNESTRTSVSSIIAAFVDQTSFQGLSFIKSSTSWCAKALWVIVFIVCMVLFSINLYYIVSLYFSYPTQTRVEMGYEALPFPSVTICNLNSIRKRESNLVPELRDFVKSLRPTTGGSTGTGGGSGTTGGGTGTGGGSGTTGGSTGTGGGSGTTGGGTGTGGGSGTTGGGTGTGGGSGTTGGSNGTTGGSTGGTGAGGSNGTTGGRTDNRGGRRKRNIPGRASNVLQNLVDARLDAAKSRLNEAHEQYVEMVGNISTDVRLEVGHQAEGLILSCSFNGLECNYTDFEVRLNNDYGNCFTFNGGTQGNQYTSRSGALYGLTLMLNIEKSEYLPGITNGHGIKVTVHPKNSLTFPEETGIALSPGTNNFIPMRMINITRPDVPYGRGCRSADDPDFQNQFNRSYTRAGCMRWCQHETIGKRCSCIQSGFSEYYPQIMQETLRFCETSDEKDCMYDVISTFKQDDKTCPMCLEPCNSQEYEIVTSDHHWPDPTFNQYIWPLLCAASKETCSASTSITDTINANVLQLQVFYSDLNYNSIIKEPAYELSQFASDIGGAVGLWLGACAMGLAELAQLFAQLTVFLVRRPSKKRTSTRETSASTAVTSVHTLRDKYTEKRSIPIKRTYHHEGLSYIY